MKSVLIGVFVFMLSGCGMELVRSEDIHHSQIMQDVKAYSEEVDENREQNGYGRLAR